MILKSRVYQTECRQALYDGWKTERRLACVLATGMGKGVIFAWLAEELKHLRPMVLVHRDELVQKAAQDIHDVYPTATIGRLGFGHYELGRDVTVASVQTLAREKRLHLLNPRAFGLIIIDECHHAAADSYMRIIDYFGGFNDGGIEDDGAIVAGFTATLVRNDKRGLGDVWQRVVFKRDILWGILHNDNGACAPGYGYLVDVRGKRIEVDGLDLGRIRKTGGDFSSGDLGEALSEAHIGNVMLKNYREYGESRQFIGFLPTVATTIEVAQIFHEGGYRVGFITGDTPIEDRKLLYKMVREKELDGLFNCMVLTEGFDLPQLSLAMIGRPTTSAGLYVQMVGRVLRAAIGKTCALVLDFVGASEDNRLASLADLSETVQKVEPEESIGEAAEREDEEIKERATGSGSVTDVHDVEFFAARSSAWLRTEKGYWFIPAGNRIYCLLPEDSSEQLFTVGSFWNGQGPKEKHSRIAESISIDYGMAWAESVAEEYSPTVARKAASWRKKKSAPASPQQINYATRLGIKNPEKLTKVQLADAMSVKIASSLIDRWEPKS